MSRQLGGRYELKEQVGGGGMAVVYRAVDTLLGRTVAVKMLRPQYIGDEEFTNRFRQEAHSVAKLSHPNIVNIYDVGITDGEYYIVMEYVDGPTLKDVIREQGSLSAEDTVYITRQICEALEHAHSHHIIHRDIKPANILITKGGLVKVTDFGIARAVTGNTMTYHHSNSVLGSVHYFSPEQARGGSADIKSDIYSLGVVMYEMLTGHVPFSGDSPVSVALKHLRDPFVEPRAYVPDIPQSLENIVLRCLVKEPGGRYADMRAVQQDLDRALRDPNAPKFVPQPSVSDATISVPAISKELLREQQRNQDAAREIEAGKGKRSAWKTLMWVGVGIGVLVIGAIAAYFIVMNLIQVPNVNLPNVVGKPVNQAVSQLESAGFPSSQITQQQGNSDKPQGTVYQQNPSPGEVKAGRTVTLYVSKGAPPITMSDFAGISFEMAKSTLIGDGFKASNIIEKQVNSTQYASGEVVSSDPPAGQTVKADAKVTLLVSKGAPMVNVPNVIGMTKSDASQALQDQGLAVGQIIDQPNPGTQNDTVFKLSAKVGSSVPQGTAIDIYVTNNPPQNPGIGGGTGNSTDNQTGSGNGTGTNSTGNTTGNGSGQ